jgi:hypothetical protein
MARPTKRRNRPAAPSLPLAVWCQVYQRAAQLVQRQAPCLLCGHAGTVGAVFVPSDPQAYGFPPGHHAARVYLLCAACLGLPDKVDKAEAILSQERRQVMAGRWN